MEKEVSLRKAVVFMMFVGILVIIFTLWCGNRIDVSAAMINGSESLGGMNYYIDKYLETHDSLYSEEDLNLLSAAMELENGMNSDECLLLTGSALLNRVYYCRWCPDTILGVLWQGFNDPSIAQQYDSRTLRRLDTVVPSERTRNLALHLLLCGPKGPKTMIYQGMTLNGKFYKQVDKEYFGLAKETEITDCKVRN